MRHYDFAGSSPADAVGDTDRGETDIVPSKNWLNLVVHVFPEGSGCTEDFLGGRVSSGQPRPHETCRASRPMILL